MQNMYMSDELNTNERKVLENNLSTEKESLKKYDALSEELKRLNENINKCLDIVNSSVRSNSVRSKIEDYAILNDKANKISINSIERDVSDTRKNIKNIDEQINGTKKDTE